MALTTACETRSRSETSEKRLLFHCAFPVEPRTNFGNDLSVTLLAYTKTVTGLPALLIIVAIIGFFIWIGVRIGRRGRRR